MTHEDRQELVAIAMWVGAMKALGSAKNIKMGLGLVQQFRKQPEEVREEFLTGAKLMLTVLAVQGDAPPPVKAN